MPYPLSTTVQHGTTPLTDQSGVILFPENHIDDTIDWLDGVPDASGGGPLGTPDGKGGMPALSSSLDPEKQPGNEDDDSIEETLPDEWVPPPEYQCPPISQTEARFWHSTNRKERKAVYIALRTMGRYRSLHRYVNCGCCSRVLFKGKIGDEFAFRVVSSKCHNRWCPCCARARSSIYAENIREWVKETHRRVRFVTLTLRHSDTPLRDQVTRLNSCILALRRRSWWKAHVNGGVTFTEIKLGRDNRYHVHAHLIVEGVFMPHVELSEEWHAVTGDSPVVDVRDVSDPDVVAGYVAKYGSKPIDRDIVFQPTRLIECIQALHGRRLAATFGSWKDLSLSEIDSADETTGWQDVGSLSSFIHSELWPVMLDVAPALAERILLACHKANPPNVLK